MAVLSTLKLVNAKKSNSISPTQLRRNKLSRKLWEQIELAKAVAAGGQYSKRRFKTFKGTDGSRASVEVETVVRQWWWAQANGRLALSVRYGTRVIALTPKSNAVECADLTELTAALTTIRQAVDAGELDSQIEAASATLRDGFKK